MNKHYLQSQFKSTGTAYLLLLFLFGSHFIYLNRWGLQILFWVTIYGFGIWLILELFLIPGRVAKHNAMLAKQIEKIEEKENLKNLQSIKAINN